MPKKFLEKKNFKKKIVFVKMKNEIIPDFQETFTITEQ